MTKSLSFDWYMIDHVVLNKIPIALKMIHYIAYVIYHAFLSCIARLRHVTFAAKWLVLAKTIHLG